MNHLERLARRLENRRNKVQNKPIIRSFNRQWKHNYKRTKIGSTEWDKTKELHLKGYSTVLIGKLLNVDHTTILYRLRKLGVPKNVQTIYRNSRFRIKKEKADIGKIIKELHEAKKKSINDKYAYLWAEQVNSGRSYAEYLSKSNLEFIREGINKGIIRKLHRYLK